MPSAKNHAAAEKNNTMSLFDVLGSEALLMVAILPFLRVRAVI
ncbi:MAG: hypothetical protein Q6353_009905 [Candidatus Sigynarchaeum springense]